MHGGEALSAPDNVHSQHFGQSNSMTGVMVNLFIALQ